MDTQDIMSNIPGENLQRTRDTQWILCTFSTRPILMQFSKRQAQGRLPNASNASLRLAYVTVRSTIIHVPSAQKGPGPDIHKYVHFPSTSTHTSLPLTLLCL